MKPPLLPTVSPKDPADVCPPCGRCCRYVALGIDAPSSVKAVSMALWFVYHRDVSIYQSHEGDWFLLVPTECDNLLPDGLCGVYEHRPFICREYDVDGCEGTRDEPAEKLRFDDGPSFVTWLASARPALYARCVTASVIPKALWPPRG